MTRKVVVIANVKTNRFSSGKSYPVIYEKWEEDNPLKIPIIDDNGEYVEISLEDTSFDFIFTNNKVQYGLQ